ncbi:MAG: hypothetical protein ACR2KT_01730 [Methylocella sp.]
MARALQKHVARRQDQTFSDWCAEVRDLAAERWPEVSDQAPTLYAVWGGGATPQQALHMVGLILPPKAANRRALTKTEDRQ